MQRAMDASTAATAAAAAPPTHPLADPLGTTQSEASADVEELYGPLPPFKGPKVARSHSETAAPPLPDRQPGQAPPPPEDAPKQPPKQQRPQAAAAPPPKPQSQPQAKPQPAKPQPQAKPQPAKPPPPRQQPAPKPAASGDGAKPSAGPQPPTGSFKYMPGEHTLPYEELKGMRAEAGIDMTRKEDYLSDADFERVFKTDRSSFRELKRWRQLEKKKEVGLF